MKKIPLLLAFLFILAFPFIDATSSYAITTQTPPPAPTHAPPKTINEAIGEQIQALVGSEVPLDAEPQETFGTRVLGVVLTFVDVARAQSDNFVNNVAELPQVSEWFTQQYANPKNLEKWINIVDGIVLILGLSIPLGIAVHILLTRARHHFVHKQTKTQLARFLAGLGRLGLAIVPLIVFLSTALILMNQSEPSKLTRYIVMNLIYAIALQRIIRILVTFLLAPKMPNLRFIPITNESALYLRQWVDRFSALIIFGYFCVDAASLVHIPSGAITAFNSFLGLCIVILAIHIITEKRTMVALFIRGSLTSYSTDLSVWESLRLWLSKTWHNLALAYLLIGYAVTTMSASGGFGLLLRGTSLTIITLFCGRIVLHSAENIGLRATSHFYRFILRSVLRLFVWGVSLLLIAAAWGADITSFLSTPWGQRILGSTVTIGLTFLGAALCYEWINASINKRLNRKDVYGLPIPATARAQTLLPLARNTALVILSSIVVIVALSELGVNIAPLLAGAGVIGVAIGFGSQSLVKDFITGLFILVEDAIAIGDVIIIGEHKGIVESMTIRTLRLRDVDGSLHILPFGEVTRITNATKGFGFAVMDIDVAYGSDIPKVVEALKKIAEKLSKSEEFAADIVEPIEILGIEKFAASSIVLRCRLKTTPGNQWKVRRAFLMGTKELFEKEGIEIPFQTIQYVSTPPATQSKDSSQTI